MVELNIVESMSWKVAIRRAQSWLESDELNSFVAACMKKIDQECKSGSLNKAQCTKKAKAGRCYGKARQHGLRPPKQ